MIYHRPLFGSSSVAVTVFRPSSAAALLHNVHRAYTIRFVNLRINKINPLRACTHIFDTAHGIVCILIINRNVSLPASSAIRCVRPSERRRRRVSIMLIYYYCIIMRSDHLSLFLMTSQFSFIIVFLLLSLLLLLSYR